MESDAEPFVLIIPPPNVTGALHIGHALTSAVQDAVIRYQRMKGRNALWVPGTDHAGIATQTVVEKKVARELGKTRHDLGREKFLQHIWAYVKEYGNTIGEQQRAMGISVDWSRLAFTLDENLTAAVIEGFVRLYQVCALFSSCLHPFRPCCMPTSPSRSKAQVQQCSQQFTFRKHVNRRGTHISRNCVCRTCRKVSSTERTGW